MTDSIYILLPVHNRREITRRFIKCLKAQTVQNWHLVLIDDGSNDGTSEMVREEVAQFSIISGGGNWWWGGALHQGYLWVKHQKVSATDLVLIANDDTEFEPDFLEQALKVLGGDAQKLLTAWCYSRQDGRLMDSGVHVDWRSFAHEQASTVDDINCLSTRGLVMRVDDFLMLGGFHPVLLPHYASDYEFTMRAKNRGMQLTSDPLFKLWVDEETTGSHAKGPLPFFATLRSFFSKRTVFNPWYRSAYIGLACPWRWKVQNWCRVWREALSQLYYAASKGKANQ